MDMSKDLNNAELRIAARAKYFGMPISGALELLPLCNMNCDMCYVRLSRVQMERQGTLRNGAQWLSLGRQMARAGVLFLQLTGGEPLLHPDFREIYLGLKKLGMILTVNTNGTLIDEEWADFFAKNKPRRLNITLYGAGRETYGALCHHPDGFDRVIRAVELLRQRDVEVKLSGSLTRANAGDLAGMVRISRELGVPLHVDPYMIPAARERNIPFDAQSRMSPEDAAGTAYRFLEGVKTPAEFAAHRAELLARVDGFTPADPVPAVPTCMAGQCGFTVSWLGHLQPCEVLTEPEADVFELGFDVAWAAVREGFRAVRYCADCSACRLRPLCSTCPAAALMETGDYMGRPEYLCRYAAEMERLLRQAGKEDT